MFSTGSSSVNTCHGMVHTAEWTDLILLSTYFFFCYTSYGRKTSILWPIIPLLSLLLLSTDLQQWIWNVIFGLFSFFPWAACFFHLAKQRYVHIMLLLLWSLSLFEIPGILQLCRGPKARRTSMLWCWLLNWDFWSRISKVLVLNNCSFWYETL